MGARNVLVASGVGSTRTIRCAVPRVAFLLALRFRTNSADCSVPCRQNGHVLDAACVRCISPACAVVGEREAGPRRALLAARARGALGACNRARLERQLDILLRRRPAFTRLTCIRNRGSELHGAAVRPVLYLTIPSRARNDAANKKSPDHERFAICCTIRHTTNGCGRSESAFRPTVNGQGALALYYSKKLYRLAGAILADVALTLCSDKQRYRPALASPRMLLSDATDRTHRSACSSLKLMSRRLAPV